MNKITQAALAAGFAFAFLPAMAAPPEVVLIGTIHDLHLEPRFHYAVTDIARQIEAVKPDAVCGEITPEAYNTPMEGYFPVEAAYLATIAPSLHTRFIPADWRVALEWQRRADAQVPKDIQDKSNAVGKAQADGVMNFKGASLYDYLNGPDFIALSDRMFEEIDGENTPADIAAGAWHERNRKIVENCLDSAPGAKRVAIVFGANHIAQLSRELKTQKIPFTVAARSFTPSGLGTVPKAVLERWKRNQDGLKAIAAGTIAASRNDRDSVIDNKNHRINELGKYIAAYSSP